jgi:adenosyl cobinamide kinase/adenosyl cobinamide phosphate guanylyltransferase
MAISELRLIKRALEYVPKENINLVPYGTRGIYALYQKALNGDSYDLVYIGMARGLKMGIRKRLRSHKKSKPNLWSHFSMFEVWDNITEKEVEELDALLPSVLDKAFKGELLCWRETVHE